MSGFKSLMTGFGCSSGKMIGKINTPERVANLCFGGAKRNRLFMCGTTSLYSLYTEAEGATLG